MVGISWVGLAWVASARRAGAPQPRSHPEPAGKRRLKNSNPLGLASWSVQALLRCEATGVARVSALGGPAGAAGPHA